MKYQIILLLILGITFSSSQKGIRKKPNHKRKRNHKNVDVCSMTKEQLEEQDKPFFEFVKKILKEDKTNCEPQLKLIMESSSDMKYKPQVDQCKEINKVIDLQLWYKMTVMVCRKLGFNLIK